NFGRSIESNGQRNPRQQDPRRAKGALRRARVTQEPKTPLQSQLSAVLRLQLLEELTGITSAEEGVAWAQRRLPAKNTLTVSDAGLIEQAFRRKMSSLEVLDDAVSPNLGSAGQAEPTGRQGGHNAPDSQVGLPGENGTTSYPAERVASLDTESLAPFLK